MEELRNHKILKLSYPIRIGSEIWQDLAELLQPAKDLGQLFILADENTRLLCLPLLVEKLPLIHQSPIFTVPPGEYSKEVTTVEDIWTWLLKSGAERQAVLLNLGGGVISDLGGFAAGTYKRGISYVNIPTSLIGQADASVGGKTGINLSGVKNAAGLFFNPIAVYIDPSFLDTLPERHLRSGHAELIKSAYLAGGEFWDLIRQKRSYNEDFYLEFILRSVVYKCDVVTEDPYERGLRNVLNFGHTVGHALEGLRMDQGPSSWLHGEAVAAGMICEGYLSYKIAGLPEAGLRELTSTIMTYIGLRPIERRLYGDIRELIHYDKKVSGGSPGFVLMEGAGKPRVKQQVSTDLLYEALDYYNLILKNLADYQGT